MIFMEFTVYAEPGNEWDMQAFHIGKKQTCYSILCRGEGETEIELWVPNEDAAAFRDMLLKLAAQADETVRRGDKR